MSGLELKIRLVSGIAEVPASAWNPCAGGRLQSTAHLKHEDKLSTELSARAYTDNPFVSHEFLASLETSHSVGPRTGWQPQHLLVETGAGELIAAALREGGFSPTVLHRNLGSRAAELIEGSHQP